MTDFLTAHEREELNTQHWKCYYVSPNKTYKNIIRTKENRLAVVRHDHIMYRYEVQYKLGKGSFSDVYKVYDHAKKKYVALKIIRNEKRFHKQGKEEIKILEILKNIHNDTFIHMIDYFVFREHICITFAYHHHNLYEELKKRKFSGLHESELYTVLIDSFNCLKTLYDNNIIHSDFKPENMLISSETDNFRIKIIDFGSACLMNNKKFTYIQSRFYRSPEIVLGLSYDMSIDIWSLGCIMFELATGNPLFPGSSEAELMILFCELLGLPPIHFLKKSPRVSHFFTIRSDDYELLRTHDRKGTTRLPGTRSIEAILGSDAGSASEKHLLVDLIKKCLQWEPDKRIKPADALKHPYFIVQYDV